MSIRSTAVKVDPPLSRDRSTPRDGLMDRLGAFIVARRRRVLALSVLAVIAAAVVGSGLFGRLQSGGFDDPGSDSARAATLLAERFDAAPADVVVVVSTSGTSVDDPATLTAGTALTARLTAEPGVKNVTSYFTTRSPALRGTAGTDALISMDLNAEGDAAQTRASEIAAAYAGPVAGTPITVGVAGAATVFAEVGDTIKKDLAKAESLAIPITMLLLLLVFGTMVAAGMPLVIAIVAVMVSFLALYVTTLVTDVSIFSVNLVTSLGLGLAIDYSLLIVSRYREELARTSDTDTAVRRAVATAGRTVVFSGVTVAIALSAMLVFPQYFLRSFAYAGIATTALAVLAAVVVLPAVLAVLGRRIDKGRILKSTTRVTDDKSGSWYRLSGVVMRRPWLFIVGGTTVLVMLGLPFARVNFGQTDDRVLPASSAVAQASQTLRTAFDSRETTPITVVLPDSRPTDASLASYAKTLSTLPDVVRVDSSVGSFSAARQVGPVTPANARFADSSGTYLSVVADVEPYSSTGKDLVAEVRGTAAPSAVVVGGITASFVDSQNAMGQRLPWAIGIIAIATFVLLFLFTGSVILPIKALVLNTLSLTAMFGAMVWIFQEGHLQWLVGDFQVTGMMDTAMPILMFCIAFGLSMDYEVFLLSRIKEEYDKSGDNTEAVRIGLQRTGRLITSAAALLAIVFLAFATSGVTIIKMMGVGIALAVLVDATVVRALMVPAFMRIAGDFNWWAPAPLRRLHNRIGLRETPDADSSSVRPTPQPAADSGVGSTTPSASVVQ